MSQEINLVFSTVLGVLGFLVSTAMLYVVIVYTRETAMMRRAASAQAEELTHQIKLSIMPAFTVEFAERPDVTDRSIPPKETWYDLVLHNVGNGVGTNIRIESMAVKNDPAIFNRKFPDGELIFKGVACLRPSASEKLAYVPSFEDHGEFADLMLWMQTYGAAGKVFPMRLRFHDIEGNEYTQTLDLSRFECVPNRVQAAPIDERSVTAAAHR